MAARVLIAVIAACLVALIALSVRPPDPMHTTVGKLSERSESPSPGRHRIANAGWGVRHAHFLVFVPQIHTRYPVVLNLEPGESDAGETYTGHVVGLVTEPVPGCPCEPPFVYVTGCRSCPAD